MGWGGEVGEGGGEKGRELLVGTVKGEVYYGRVGGMGEGGGKGKGKAGGGEGGSWKLVFSVEDGKAVTGM